MLSAKTLFWGLLTLFVWMAPAQADPVPEKNFNLVQGGTMRLNDLKGKVLVVNFWATWCPPCRDEIPALTAIQKRLSPKGLQVVGVDFMENLEQQELAKFMEEFDFNYPVVFGGRQEIRALGQYLGGMLGLPTSFFLNREGKVTYIHTGALSEDQLLKIVQPMLTD